jgi:hypothetical protein
LGGKHPKVNIEGCSPQLVRCWISDLINPTKLGRDFCFKKGGLLEVASNTKKRILKVISGWDYQRDHVKPQIRLEGKWLIAAGLNPESHVEVCNPKSGVLILRLLSSQE